MRLFRTYLICRVLCCCQFLSTPTQGWQTVTRAARICRLLFALGRYSYSVYSGQGRLRLLAVPRWRLMSLLECVEEDVRERIIHTLCQGCVKGGQ